MDDKLCRQAVALRDLSLSRFAAAQGAALNQQLRPGGTMDGAVHASAAQQAFIGSIDDGIHLHGGNIVSYNLQGHDSTSSLSGVIISQVSLRSNLVEYKGEFHSSTFPLLVTDQNRYSPHVRPPLKIHPNLVQ